jgi:hypothetical protein
MVNVLVFIEQVLKLTAAARTINEGALCVT